MLVLFGVPVVSYTGTDIVDITTVQYAGLNVGGDLKTPRLLPFEVWGMVVAVHPAPRIFTL